MKNQLQYFFCTLILLVVAAAGATAQMKVGNNPTTINTNSLLELESTNKGLLLPRVTLTSTTATAPLTAHIAGMTIYNTATANDVVPGYYYNDGTRWVQLGPAGNEPWYDVATLTPATSVTQNIYQLGAQTGLGTSTPNQRLDIVTTNTNADNIHLTSIGSNPSPTLRMRSAEGTVAAPGYVLAGTTIGSVINSASVGVPGAFADITSMRSVATEPHSATGLGGRMDFYTVANGTTGTVSRMTIDHTGFVGISTQTPNAQLSLGQTFVSPANSVTTTGTYRKITLQQNVNDEYGIGITAGSVDFYRSLGGSVAMVRLGAHNGGGFGADAFYPSSNGLLYLGTPVNRWSTIYGINGDLTNTLTVGTNVVSTSAIGSAAIGTGNTIPASATSAVAIGTGNSMSAINAMVVGASNNNQSQNSLVVGNNNFLDSGVGTGYTRTNRGTILAGGSNTVSGGENYNSIISGSQNTINGTCFESIVIGYQTTVTNSQKVVVSGQGHSVYNALGSAVLGNFNSVSAVHSLVAGTGEALYAGADYSVALGTANSIRSAVGVALGQGNTIAANHNNSMAIGTNVTTTAATQFVSGFAGGYRLYTNSANTVGVSLAANGTTFTSISDRRSKENISSLGYGLKAVMALRPTQYNYIGVKKTSLGFIAQEVKTVLPEVVEKTDMGPNHDYLGINYTEIIPVLTKAIQELKAENDQIKSKNTALVSEVATLKNSIAELAALTQQVKEMQVALGLKNTGPNPPVRVAGKAINATRTVSTR